MKSSEHLRLSLDVPATAFTVIAGPPEWISQLTAPREIGVTKRNFLEDLASGVFDGEVIKRGKLRIVRRADYIEFLRRRSEAAKQSGEDRAGVLADLGLRVVG